MGVVSSVHNCCLLEGFGLASTNISCSLAAYCPEVGLAFERLGGDSSVSRCGLADPVEMPPPSAALFLGCSVEAWPSSASCMSKSPRLPCGGLMFKVPIPERDRGARAGDESGRLPASGGGSGCPELGSWSLGFLGEESSFVGLQCCQPHSFEQATCSVT
jgi:hypothetical protein